MKYPGGKNCAGTYQRIINLIPPHDTFAELFAGSAAITRLKRPARQTVLVDLDAAALSALKGHLPPHTICHKGDALTWLRFLVIDPDEFTPRHFLYVDPPYLNVRSRYAVEFSPAEHEELLKLLVPLPCMVMISGYRTDLYNSLLRDWWRVDFDVITRGGTMATESLWLNYPRSAVLHDPRYAGQNYRQRENLARKKRRWAARIAAMPPEERQSLLESLTAGLDAEERASLARNLALPPQMPVAAATGIAAGAVPRSTPPAKRSVPAG